MEALIVANVFSLFENAKQKAAKCGKTSVHQGVKKDVCRVVTRGAVKKVIAVKVDNMAEF